MHKNHLTKLIDISLVILLIISIITIFKVNIFDNILIYTNIALFVVLSLLVIFALKHPFKKIRKVASLLLLVDVLMMTICSYKLYNLDQSLAKLDQKETGIHYLLKTNESKEVKHLGILELGNKEKIEDLIKDLNQEFKDLEISYYHNIHDIEAAYHNKTIDSVIMLEDYYRIIEENKLYDNKYLNYKDYQYETKRELKFDKDELINIYFSSANDSLTVNNLSRSDINKYVILNLKEKKMLVVNIPDIYFLRQKAVDDNYDSINHAHLFSLENAIGAIDGYSEIKTNRYLRINLKLINELYDLEIEEIMPYLNNGERSVNEKNLIDKSFKELYSLETFSHLDSLDKVLETNLSKEEMKALLNNDWDIQIVDLSYSEVDDYVYSLGINTKVAYPNMAAIKELKQHLLSMQ